MIRFGVTAAVAVIGLAMASDASAQLCPPAARLDLNAATAFRTGVLPIAVAPGCDEASQDDWTNWVHLFPAAGRPFQSATRCLPIVGRSRHDHCL